jgi:hypothetical protein
LDAFDKIINVDEKSKDKEKKKEKKGMLGGLFKRNKKGVAQEAVERTSEDSRQSAQSKESLESLSSRPEPTTVTVERRPSKLQKTPPTTSPKSSPTETRPPQREPPLQQQGTTPAAPIGPAPPPPTVRRVGSESELDEHAAMDSSQTLPTGQVNRFPSLTEKRSIFAPITTALKSSSGTGPDPNSSVKPVYSKRAKERFAIDESESEDDTATPKTGEQNRESISPIGDMQEPATRSDSAMQVSPVEAAASNKFDNPRYQPESTLRSSPFPIEGLTVGSEGTASTSKPSPSTATHTPSTSRSTPTWSDASLRHYMENDQDIKDLLIIVHDKSNVTPVSADHPLMTNLFSDERTKLAEMQSQLDSMLMGWLSRKNSNLLSATK